MLIIVYLRCYIKCCTRCFSAVFVRHICRASYECIQLETVLEFSMAHLINIEKKLPKKWPKTVHNQFFSFVICFSLRLINVFESIIMWIIIQNNVQSSNERWRDQVICIKNSCYLHFGISGLGWISFGYTFALAINRQKQEAIHRNVSFWIQYSVIPFNFRLFQGDEAVNFNGLIERIEWQ